MPAGAQCSDRFWEGQILESNDPAYYAVHHLSVPAYYLQHSLYSREGWLRVHALLGEFLFDGLTPQLARQKYSQDFSSGKREWSIVRGEKLAEVGQVQWSLTMAEVSLDTAAKYCADVQRWAESVYRDSQAMVKRVQNL